MPVTTLDAHTALLIVDLQKGVVGMPGAHPVDGVVANSRLLLDAFRARGLPVVLITVAGVPSGRTEAGSSLGSLPPGFDELIAELDQQPEDIHIVKHARGAFTKTGLDERLTELGVTQVVIAGIATSAGVESTGRQAHENGYNVTLATDAMTDRSLEAHEHSVATVFPRISETGTTAEIIALLERTHP